MKLTPEEARDVVYGDTHDWDEIESKIVDTRRWSTVHEGIFKHIPSGKHYEFNWSDAATEQQDESPFEYEDEVVPIEVVKKVVTVEKWVKA